MPDHRIRFRGGWKSGPVDGDESSVRRLTLPVEWPDGIAGPIRLVRRFGRPPIEPGSDSAWLELRQVPGLRSLRLNGLELGPPPAGVVDWTVPLAGLLEARNTLILEVVPVPVASGAVPGGWGMIALVIGPGAGRVE